MTTRETDPFIRTTPVVKDQGYGAVVPPPFVTVQYSIEEWKRGKPGTIVSDPHSVLQTINMESTGFSLDLREGFNRFLSRGIVSIMTARPIKESQNTIIIPTGNVRVVKPTRPLSDTESTDLTPDYCLTNRLTYESSVQVEMCRKNLRTQSRETLGYVTIGPFPIMTGSLACVLTDSEGVLKPQKILSERYGECSSDPHGYFIVNGTHYVLVMQDKLRVNTPFTILLSKKSNVDPEAGANPYPGLICTSASPLGTTVLRIYRSRLGREFKLSLSQLSVIDFDPHIRNVNIATVLLWMRKYMLSLEGKTESSEDIYGQVYEDVGSRIQSSLPESHYGKVETYLNASFAAPNNESSLSYRQRIEAFARHFRMGDATELAVIREYIALVLPHIDHDYSHLRLADIIKLKYDTLISFFTRFMEFIVGIIPLDDRDDYGNKMLETAGSRMERKFLEIWAGMGRNFKRGRPIVTVASAIEAAIEAGGSKSIIEIINQRLKPRMIDYMELFNGGRTYVPESSSGFAKPLIWDSLLSPFVYIREIAAKVNEQSKNAALRSVAPSQLGYVCFVTTREGKGCGKIKALSLGARLSAYGNPYELRKALEEITATTPSEGSVEIYIDHVPQGLYLIDSENPWLQVAELRRQGLIAWDTGIVYKEKTHTLNLLISPNRLVRPLLTVTNAEIGKRKLLMDEVTFDIVDSEGKLTDTISAWDMLYEQKLSEGSLGFQTLLSEGIVEYVDAAEQAQIQVAQHIWDMEERQASYLELKRKIEVSGSEAKHAPEPQPEGLLIRGGPEYKQIQEEKKAVQLRLRSGGQRLAPEERIRLLSRQKELEQKYEGLFHGSLWERLSKERKDIEGKRAQVQVQRIAAEAQVPAAERNVRNPIWLEYLDQLEAVNTAHDAWREEYLQALNKAQVVDPNALRSTRSRLTPIDIATTLEAQLDRARRYADITHCELDPASVLSVQAALIPFIGHNQAPRNTFQCKMSNQSVGIIHSRYLNRFALELRVLAYPQRALVETNAHQLLGMDALPAGNSVRLAIAPERGWNQEDALVAAKDYIDRGGLVYMQHSGYSHVLTQSGATRDEFKAPEAASRSDIYHGLGPDGIARRGAYLKEGDVWLNVRRTLPRDESGELKYHDINFTVKAGKDGIVDYVHVYKSRGGADAVTVRLSHYQAPQEGDKYHIRPAQKATLARIKPREDMPYTNLVRKVGEKIVTEIISPDVIMNSHAIPSRMTIGTIIEMLLGWPATMMGIRFNAAATRPWNLNEFVRMLAQLPGFSNLGVFYLKDGETGETMRSSVHVGYSHIGELRHYVKDKIQSRSVGRVDALKRQPLSGRGRTQGAAVKLGEMERDTFIGHGVSELTYERFCIESDRFLVTACRTCRSMLGIRYATGTRDQGFSCRACGERAELVNVNIPYTFRHIIFETTALGLAQRLILEKASAEIIDDTGSDDRRSSGPPKSGTS